MEERLASPIEVAFGEIKNASNSNSTTATNSVIRAMETSQRSKRMPSGEI